MDARAPLAVREPAKTAAEGAHAPAARAAARTPAGPASAGHHFDRIAVERIPPPPPPIQRRPAVDDEEEEDEAPATQGDYFSSLFAKDKKKKSKLKPVVEVDVSQVTAESVAALPDKKLVVVIDMLTYDDSEDSGEEDEDTRTPYGGRRPSVVPRPKPPRLIDPAKKKAVGIALREARRRRLPLKPSWAQFFIGGGEASPPAWLAKRPRGLFRP